MGITNFSALLKICPGAIKQYPLSFLRGKRIAIDAMWFGYTYWSIAYKKEVNSIDILTEEVNFTRIFDHFVSLLKLQLNRLFLNNILPVFVMDGKPSKIKYEHTVDKRKEDKKTKIDYINELKKKIDEEGVIKCREEVKDYIKAVKGNARFTYEYSLKYINFIRDLGIPYLKAQGITGEADKLCVYLLKHGYVQGVFSNDRDFLVFGAKYLITGYTGVKYNKYTNENIHHLSIIDLNSILYDLEITYLQLVDVCILAGCDYNKKLAGVGITNIYKLIKDYGSIENLPSKYTEKLKITNYDIARKMFLLPEIYSDLAVEPDYKLELSEGILGRIDTVLEKYNITNWSSRIKGFYARFLETRIIVNKTSKGIIRLKVRKKNPQLDTNEEGKKENIVSEITMDMKSFFLG